MLKDIIIDWKVTLIHLVGRYSLGFIVWKGSVTVCLPLPCVSLPIFGFPVFPVFISLISPHLCLDFVPGVSSHVPLQIVCSAPCLLWIIVNVGSSVSVCTCPCHLRVFIKCSKEVPCLLVLCSWLLRATSVTQS